MKSPITTELRNPNGLREKYTLRISFVLLILRISVILVIAILGIFSSNLYLAQAANNTRQIYILAYAYIFTALLNILAIRYSLKKQVETAVYLMIASIILFVAFATFFISGIGLILGISGLIIIYLIATLTLIQPQLTSALITAIAFSVALIILDTFIPYQRLEAGTLTTYLPIIAVVGIGTFTYYFLQGFSDYPFRIKLILFFIIVAVFSVTAIATITNILTRNEITKQVGRNQQILAERLALETSNDLEAQVENLQAIASQLEASAEKASNSYTGTDDEISTHILALDQTWRAGSNQSALIQNVLNNNISDDLRQFQQRFPSHTEVFLTDKYGANIAATSQTSDYYQADEDWWRSAYNQGRGRVYISQPEFDESSQTIGLLIAIPVTANGKVVGVLRSTYSVSPILANLQSSETDGIVDIDLRTSFNTYVNGTQIAPEDLPGLNSVTGKYGKITYKGEPSLVSQYRVFSSADSLTLNSVSLLNWTIIVRQNLDDALQPVQQQTNAITILAIAITLLAGLIGYVASIRLAAPLITLTGIASKIAEGDLSIQAQVQTQDEIGELASSFNKMTNRLQSTLGSLERRVAERTADLDMARIISERRAQELQSISEISRAISTEQKLEILIPLITRLVSEHFNFYHVGIFFVDNTRRYAYLQAANSEGGQAMLARGHRLEVGTGLVGTVAQTGIARIALDVGSDAAFFNNPDLPKTRSEMALPLNIHGQAIGILDVQSIKPGAFTENDVSTLGILADQIAITIENARLFSQTQQAREEAEALYTQIQRQEWGAFSQQESKIGYRQTSTGGKRLTKPMETNEIRQALESGQVIVLDGKDNRTQASISIPVKLRGQTIGMLNIKAPKKDRKWNQDEINLAQAVSDRLALALDNARLLQESQRRAAKEVKIGEVTAKIGTSINIRNVLQTAVEELGRALPGSEVIIQFNKDQ